MTPYSAPDLFGRFNLTHVLSCPLSKCLREILRIGRRRHCLPAHHYHPLQRPGTHPFSVLLRGLACPDGWVGLKGHPSQKVQTCSSGDRDPALLLVGSHGEALASKLALSLLTHPKLQSLGKGKFCHSETNHLGNICLRVRNSVVSRELE